MLLIVFSLPAILGNEMTSVNTIGAQEYTPSQLRRATAYVAQDLFERTFVYEPGMELPTVNGYLRMQYGDKQLPFSILKAERYATGAAISNLIFRHVLHNPNPAATDEGPYMQFAAYTPTVYEAMRPPEVAPDDPYTRFWDNILSTFAVAEQKLENSAQAPALHHLQKRYDWIMGRDTSIHDTRLPVGPHKMASQSEGPPQATHFVQNFAIALSKEPGEHDKPSVVKRAHEAVILPMKHASQHVLPFRGIVTHANGRNVDDGMIGRPSLEPGQKIVNMRKATLTSSSNGSCRLDLGDEYVPTQLWTQNNPPRHEMLRCQLSLVRLNRTDTNSTLENFLHAVINQAVQETDDRLGLFTPELALHYWQEIEPLVHDLNSQLNGVSANT